jgi:hypothetical protein
MTIYYIRGYQASAKVTAFPKVSTSKSRPIERSSFSDLQCRVSEC